jgi:hypothetical protein
MRQWLVHAEYLVWSMKAVKLANDAWQARRPYPGETLMTKEGLHLWLFRWGIETGRIKDSGIPRDMPPSYYVSLVFRKDMESVKEAARNYWHVLLRDRRKARRVPR